MGNMLLKPLVVFQQLIKQFSFHHCRMLGVKIIILISYFKTVPLQLSKINGIQAKKENLILQKANQINLPHTKKNRLY